MDVLAADVPIELDDGPADEKSQPLLHRPFTRAERIEMSRYREVFLSTSVANMPVGRRDVWYRAGKGRGMGRGG